MIPSPPTRSLDRLRNERAAAPFIGVGMLHSGGVVPELDTGPEVVCDANEVIDGLVAGTAVWLGGVGDTRVVSDVLRHLGVSTVCGMCAS